MITRPRAVGPRLFVERWHDAIGKPPRPAKSIDEDGLLHGGLLAQ
jgi:hypothetical protein